MINWPLMRWEIRQLRWGYVGLFTFFMVWLAVLLFLDAAGSSINWKKMNFLGFGMYWALFGGMAFVVQGIKGGTMEFLLARPVSRRELYHALVLAGGAPIVILIISPSIFYALKPSHWYASFMFFGQLLTLNLLRAAWVTVLFLLGILTGLYIGYYRNKYYSAPLQAFAIAVMIAISISIGVSSEQNFRFSLQWLIQNRPGLSLLLSLALCCLFYFLGRRRLERMDI